MDERQRVRDFENQLLLALAKITVELGKAMGGEFPDETRRAIHEHLRPLSDAAIGVPETVSALHLLDRLVAMFPPPSR